MSDPIRFVDWLAIELQSRGTQRGFGVPGGGSSLDLIAALRAQNIDTVVTAREDAAIMMAGVSGLLAHSPGVAFTTKGPGLASATNGLASAALDRLPALVIAETFEADELGYLTHQVYDQAALARPLLSQAGTEVLSASTGAVSAWLDSIVNAPGAPAVMFAESRAYAASVPAQRSQDRTSAKVRTASGELASGELASGELDRASRRIAAASKPIFIAGLDCAGAGVSDALLPLAERLGVPVLCTYMAKGALPDSHPLFAGIFTGGSIEQACVNAADLIVLVGLDPVELIRKPWPYAAPVLDLCARERSPHYVTPEIRVAGPLPAVLDAIVPEGRQSQWQSQEIGSHRDHFLAGMQTPEADEDLNTRSGLSPSTTVQAIARAFATGPEQPRLCVDAGAHMFSACAYWPCHRPLDLLISNGLATMGFAIPAAIAAALHEPDRGAVAITGDGGALMCLGELKTLAETRAPATVFVFNDGRLSLIDIKREDRQMPDLGMAWQPPNFATVADGFGLPSWSVRTDEALQRALDERMTIDGPALIDLHIDSSGYRGQLKALRG